MFRKMLVVLAIAGLATTFAVAQTKYDGLSLSTLHIYTTQGVGAYNQAPLEELTVSGTVLQTGWFYGYHGISVLPDEKHVLGADGLYTGQNWLSHSDGNWVANMNGGSGINNACPNNVDYGLAAKYNDYYGMGTPLVYPWAVANDWEAGNKAYIMSRGYLDGTLNIWRLSTDGTIGGAFPNSSPQIPIEAEARLDGNGANPYGYITIAGQMLYGTKGYNYGGGVYQINKNFANHDAMSWFINKSDVKYANTLIASSPNDWRGLGFDSAGNCYVEFKKSTGTFNIAKFDSAGNLLNDALVDLGALSIDPTDMKVAAGTLFVSGSKKIAMFDLNGISTGTINLTYTPNSLDVMGPVPEPSSIFGLFVGGSSLLALLRRKAR